MASDSGSFLDIFSELEENQKEKERKVKEAERKEREKQAKELAEKQERERKERERKEKERIAKEIAENEAKIQRETEERIEAEKDARRAEEEKLKRTKSASDKLNILLPEMKSCIKKGKKCSRSQLTNYVQQFEQLSRSDIYSDRVPLYAEAKNTVEELRKIINQIDYKEQLKQQKYYKNSHKSESHLSDEKKGIICYIACTLVFLAIGIVALIFIRRANPEKVKTVSDIVFAIIVAIIGGLTVGVWGAVGGIFLGAIIGYFLGWAVMTVFGGIVFCILIAAIGFFIASMINDMMYWS